MPVTKEQDRETSMDAAIQQRTMAIITPKPMMNKSAEFYGNLGNKLSEAAKNIVGDAGTKLNFNAILKNANITAVAGMDRGVSLQLNESRMKQGKAVRDVLDDYEALRISVLTGNPPSALKLAESGNVLNGLSGPNEQKLAELTDWKNSLISQIRQTGAQEQAQLSAKFEQMKKDAVIEHITNSIATRYAIEYPQSDKASVQPLIKDAVTNAWAAAYREVFG